MKKILCFGDSNTWGHDPGTGERLPRDKRWTGVLDRNTDSEYRIIEEGLNGRTTVWDDPIEGVPSGLSFLRPCLESHKPMHLVIIMLGTNDLKTRFSLNAYDVAEGVGRLVDVVRKSETGHGEGSPSVLVVSPPPVEELSEFKGMFRGAREKSKDFSEQFRRVSGEKECYFLDAGEFAKCSDIDGIHLVAEEHEKLGKAIAEKLRKIDFS